MPPRATLFLIGSALLHASVVGLLSQKIILFELTEHGSSALDVEIVTTPQFVASRKMPAPQPVLKPDQNMTHAVTSTPQQIETVRREPVAAEHPLKSERRQKTPAVLSQKPTKKISLETPERNASQPVLNTQQQLSTNHNRSETTETKIQTDKTLLISTRELVDEKDNREIRELDSRQVVRLVQRQFLRFFYYPATAQRRHWEGKVVLGFVITPSGRLEQIEVDKSSGYVVLDEAALHALKKVTWKENVTLAKNDAGKRQFLPVEYKLLDD